MRNRVAWWRIAFGLGLVVATALLLLPVPDGLPPTDDKLGHGLMFGGLTVLGVLSRLRSRWLLPGMAGYAVLTEVMQATLTRNRTGDPADVAADVLGVVSAWALLRLPARLARRRDDP